MILGRSLEDLIVNVGYCKTAFEFFFHKVCRESQCEAKHSLRGKRADAMVTQARKGHVALAHELFSC